MADEIESTDLFDGGDEPQETQSPETQQSQETQGTESQPSRQDPNSEMTAALRELRETFAKSQQPQQPQAGRQPTQDEINAHWAVYNPTAKDPDFFAKYLRLPADMDPAERQQVLQAHAQLFGQIQEGLVKQAVVGARNIMQMELQKLREEYTPFQQMMSQQRSEGVRNRFYQTYGALKDPRFEKIVGAAARDLANQNFADEPAYFKALAESAAGSIKGLMPDFDLGAKPQQPQGTRPRLPRTSVGGSGGAGGQGGGQQQGSSKSKDDSGSLW